VDPDEPPTFQRLSVREKSRPDNPVRTIPPGQVSDPLAPSSNSRMIFVAINMSSDLVELAGLEPLAPCLQISSDPSPGMTSVETDLKASGQFVTRSW